VKGGTRVRGCSAKASASVAVWQLPLSVCSQSRCRPLLLLVADRIPPWRTDSAGPTLSGSPGLTDGPQGHAFRRVASRIIACRGGRTAFAMRRSGARSSSSAPGIRIIHLHQGIGSCKCLLYRSQCPLWLSTRGNPFLANRYARVALRDISLLPLTRCNGRSTPRRLRGLQGWSINASNRWAAQGSLRTKGDR
jgi:hypothetical protein